MRDSTGDPRRRLPRDDSALLPTLISAAEGLGAELRALRADVREIINLLQDHQRTVAGPESKAQVTEALPALMTIHEAAERLRVSPRALYMRIRRGDMPGVVRVGSRRLMVKTDEFLRGLHRMPTVE